MEAVERIPRRVDGPRHKGGGMGSGHGFKTAISSRPPPPPAKFSQAASSSALWCATGDVRHVCGHMRHRRSDENVEPANMHGVDRSQSQAEPGLAVSYSAATALQRRLRQGKAVLPLVWQG